MVVLSSSFPLLPDLDLEPEELRIATSWGAWTSRWSNGSSGIGRWWRRLSIWIISFQILC